MDYLETCFVCNELLDSIKMDLSISANISGKQIYQFIEEFTNTKLNQEDITDKGICDICLEKFNNFDELISRAEAIQNEITNSLLEPSPVYMVEEVESEEQQDYDEDEGIYQKQELKDEDEEGTIKYESHYFDDDPGDNEIDSSVIVENDEYQMEVIVDDTKENASLVEATNKWGKKQVFKTKPMRLTVPREREVFSPGKVFQCDVCQKIFKDRSKLKVHREIHTDERNVICPDCGKGFKTLNCLRNHKRMHLPDRVLFGCDQCDKKYTQKVQLKKHFEIVHMNRRDYECQACFATFGTKSVLKMHMLSHSDQRNEVCTVCGFRVHTKAKLRRHMKSHTGERNYECGICGKKFLYSYNVVAHVRNVHEKAKNRPAFQEFSGLKKDEEVEDENIEYIYEEI